MEGKKRKCAVVCCVCEQEISKYCCPACHRQTCSLPCVQRHKEISNCSGKRSRTEFVPPKEFSDRMLFSDLHFLEDVQRVKETNWRNLRRVALVFQKQEIFPHQRKLRYEARQRDMILKFLPRGMSRNKSNSSWFDFRRQEICWDIDWNIGNTRFRRKRVPESELVSAALHQVLPDPAEDVVVLMKKANSPSNEAQFYELELTGTLKSQLQGKEIVEYPVLWVRKREDCSKYCLIQTTVS